MAHENKVIKVNLDNTLEIKKPSPLIQGESDGLCSSHREMTANSVEVTVSQTYSVTERYITLQTNTYNKPMIIANYVPPW